MTDAELVKPFLMLIDWCRTFHFNIGEHSITFFEVWTFGIIVGVVVWFIKFIMD